LYGGENQFAQSILNMIDYGNEHSHRLYKQQLANGTAVKSNSQARKDVAYIHSLYFADIESRNQPPMSDEETINRLIADFAETHRNSKEAWILNSIVNGGGKAETVDDEWNAIHDIFLNF